MGEQEVLTERKRPPGSPASAISFLDKQAKEGSRGVHPTGRQQEKPLPLTGFETKSEKRTQSQSHQKVILGDSSRIILHDQHPSSAGRINLGRFTSWWRPTVHPAINHVD
ncbi:hypothetical protein AVEN_208329-1 [Araneus ventricosus]|uniref:Uncharacterized protein n=1 Tax=Araneus ventricosus TaxID=182803 RepID=A0A4Y2NYX1_ARAVE|nr:hypothetical protein AVEN_208329-1 [Araneus ventricosus]